MVCQDKGTRMRENGIVRHSLCPRDYHAITWCIFLCTIVCYVERMGFSVAFTEAAERGGLSETLKGKVLSSFFIGYAGMQIPAGWLAAHYGGSRVLAASFALWGLISLLFTPGTVDNSHTGFMITCRIAIGAAQGLFIPPSHTLLAQWIPVHERSRLVSMAMSGMYLGSALAMVVVPIIVKHLGPAAEFRCAGLIAFCWLALWLSIGSDPPEGSNEYSSLPVSDSDDAGKYAKGSQEKLIVDTEDLTPFIRGGTARSSRSRSPIEGRSNIADVESTERIHEGNRANIPWGVMMRTPAIWAIIATNFAFHYATYVLMYWLPTYFRHLLDESLYDMGTIFKMMPYMMMFAASNAGGWLGTWAHISAKMSIQASRKLVNTLGFGIAVVSLLLMPRAKHWMEGVTYTTIALASLGLSRGGWAVNHMDISPRHAGVVMGIANGAGTLAGLMGGWLTGRILEVMGGTAEPVAWSLALGIVAFICSLALLVFLFLARGDVLFR